MAVRPDSCTWHVGPSYMMIILAVLCADGHMSGEHLNAIQMPQLVRFWGLQAIACDTHSHLPIGLGHFAKACSAQEALPVGHNMSVT